MSRERVSGWRGRAKRGQSEGKWAREKEERPSGEAKAALRQVACRRATAAAMLCSAEEGRGTGDAGTIL